MSYFGLPVEWTINERTHRLEFMSWTRIQEILEEYPDSEPKDWEWV